MSQALLLALGSSTVQYWPRKPESWHSQSSMESLNMHIPAAVLKTDWRRARAVPGDQWEAPWKSTGRESVAWTRGQHWRWWEPDQFWQFGMSRLQAVMTSLTLPPMPEEVSPQCLTHISWESSLWRFAESGKCLLLEEEVFNMRQTFFLRGSILSYMKTKCMYICASMCTHTSVAFKGLGTAG